MTPEVTEVGPPTLAVATDSPAIEEVPPSLPPETDEPDTAAQVAADTQPLDIPEPTAPQPEPGAGEGIVDTGPLTAEPATEPATEIDPATATEATPALATDASAGEPSAEEPAISPFVMYTLPLVALVGFMALVWVILRGGV